MIKYVSPFVILASLVTTSQSFALIRELAHCMTSNGKYNVWVYDNQEYGPGNISVQVTEPSGAGVASYAVKEFRNMSASSGGLVYQDRETSGQNFSFQGPSANNNNYLSYRDNYVLRVQLPFGQGVISDPHMLCSRFDGVPVSLDHE